MTLLTLPKFDDIDAALSKTSLKFHPSQVHGLICGILCGHTNNKNAWEKLIVNKKESAKTHEVLQALYDITAAQLNDFLFEFQLILPDDETPLPERAESLTLWCQGFLSGLKMSDIPIEHREESEVTEAINDIVEITKMNYEDVVANDEDETAYIELVEYVRMAIILIYQDLHQADNAKKLH